MKKPITIAVDAMGGDNAPHKIIDGIEFHHKLSKNVFYYSPNPDETWTMGFGVSFWDFIFETSVGDQKLSLTSVFFDYGVQEWGEDYPVAFKIQLDPYGLAIVPSLGFRFFF